MFLWLGNVALALYVVGNKMMRKEKNRDLRDVLPDQQLPARASAAAARAKSFRASGAEVGEWESAAWANTVLQGAWPKVRRLTASISEWKLPLSFQHDCLCLCLCFFRFASTVPLFGCRRARSGVRGKKHIQGARTQPQLCVFLCTLGRAPTVR